MKNIIFNIDKNPYFRDNPDFFNDLLNLVNTISRGNTLLKCLQTTHKYLMEWLNVELKHCLNDDFFTPQTKIYWVLHGLTDFPSCENPMCHIKFSNRNVSSISKGYPRYCSHVCAVNDPKTKEKAKQTCIDKYGCVSPAQNENVKNKSKKTCLERYGVEYTFQSENNIKKTKQTFLKKYGVEHPSAVKEIIEKIEQTKQLRYGDIKPWHSAESLNKRKTTWIDHYGVDHPMKNDSIKDQAKNTLKNHYGVDHFSKSSEFKYSRAKLSYEKILMTNAYDMPMFSLNEYNCRTNDVPLKFKCKKCNKIFEAIHRDGYHHRCPNCYPVNTSCSSEEKEVLQYIKQLLNTQVLENTKTIISPLELDIYIPSKKLAIEFDGLYWHSDCVKYDKNYHLNKTNLCEKQGIQLVHIFENEWLFKQDIVKSRLKNLLGVYDKTIFARKCEIKEVDSKTSREFQEENHIQGAIGSKVNLGLFYENELISLMTFGKCRFSKKYEWELLRFCNKLGYHIPGAAGKLLKYFEKNYKPKLLVSYADRRWSQGKLYDALGFKLDHISNPNYWYFKTNDLILYSRVQYQKHKLKTILTKYDDALTEVENMQNNGYFRIFDCGNLVYFKHFNI